MPRKKSGKEHIRKLQEASKGGYYLSLPVRLIRELKWQDRQKLTVVRYGVGLKVQDWERKRRKIKKKY